VVDDAGQFGAAPDEIACRELALEDGILKMVTVASHGFEDLAQAFVVADIVTDEIRLPHSITLAEIEWQFVADSRHRQDW